MPIGVDANMHPYEAVPFCIGALWLQIAHTVTQGDASAFLRHRAAPRSAFESLELY